MNNRTSRTHDLNGKLRSIHQRIANAKIDRRILAAQMEALSLEIEEMEQCEEALKRALVNPAPDHRVLSRPQRRR